MEAAILTVFASIIGLSFGSFINVLVFRTKENQTILGRSKCRKCLEPVSTVDLVPVLNYFWLKGRCRHCSSVIEWQYPVIELVMGVLFGLLFVRAYLGYGFPPFAEGAEWLALYARDVVMAVFLLVIFVYDARYGYILDRYSVPAMILALVFNLSLGAEPASLLLGGLMIGGFFAIQFLISQGRWIGGGDIRMGLLMGFLLGIGPGLLALFIAYVLGALVGIILIANGTRKHHEQIPFGTFLAAGTLVAMVFGQDILTWYMGLFS